MEMLEAPKSMGGLRRRNETHGKCEANADEAQGVVACGGNPEWAVFCGWTCPPTSIDPGVGKICLGRKDRVLGGGGLGGRSPCIFNSRKTVARLRLEART